jgi:formyltetrahydrofolate-dependent phosphoribosylglycinamide formyltransferase
MINAMALLRSDVLDLFMALDAGSLTPALVSVDSASACVVKMLAPFSFPEKPLVGESIDVSGVRDATKLFVHCADSPAPDKLVTKANRLATVVATGSTLNEAEQACESEVPRITGSVFHRPDIASAPAVAAAVAAQRAVRKIRIGVVGSTRGSSLQPILYAIRDGRLNAEIAVVVGNVASSYILQRARVNNLKAVCIPGKGRVREEFDRDVTKALEDAQVDVVLLIGFMRIISGEFCQRWNGRLLNVHPSLLPLHAGLMDLQVHQAVLDAGDKESGCTVHQVIEQVDGGEVVCQPRVVVVPGETANSLKAKVQPLEGEALIQACEMFYNDRTLPGDTDYIAKKALVDGADSMHE